MTKQEHWLEQPERHDYDAAQDYLSLLGEEEGVREIVRRMYTTNDILWYKAKDLLRASQLPLLPESSYHVNKDLRKVKNGEKLSPVLLVRGGWVAQVPLLVADGYHRICASYLLDENAEIPCRIV